MQRVLSNISLNLKKCWKSIASSNGNGIKVNETTTLSKDKFNKIIANNTEWQPELATNSESIVKAERGDGKTIPEMVKETIEKVVEPEEIAENPQNPTATK